MSFFSKEPVTEFKPIELNKMMRLAGEIDDAADNGLMSAESMEELSADLGVPQEQLYAGLSMAGSTSMKREHEVAFVVCTGACQSRGALECVSKLVNMQADLVDDGVPAFDIVSVQCLNRCQSGPVVEIRSNDGTAVLGRATPDSLKEAVGELFE